MRRRVVDWDIMNVRSGAGASLPPPLWGRVGVGGTGAKPRIVAPPTLTLPHKGGGDQTRSRFWLRSLLAGLLSLSLATPAPAVHHVGPTAVLHLANDGFLSGYVVASGDGGTLRPGRPLLRL